MNNHKLLLALFGLVAAILSCGFTAGFGAPGWAFLLTAPASAALCVALLHFRFFAPDVGTSTAGEKAFGLGFTAVFLLAFVFWFFVHITNPIILAASVFVLSVSLSSLWAIVFVGIIKMGVRSGN